MKLYAHGVLKITETPEPFQDQNGQTVTYFKNYFKTDDGELLEINSSKNFVEFEGQTGIATITARKTQDGKTYKLSLNAFQEGATLNEEDGTIT